MSEFIFEVDGYEYFVEKEVESDVVKYNHLCKRDGEFLSDMPPAFINYSPYKLMTRDLFTYYISL